MPSLGREMCSVLRSQESKVHGPQGQMASEQAVPAERPAFLIVLLRFMPPCVGHTPKASSCLASPAFF